MTDGPLCQCGHRDHDGGPGWEDYPQRGGCRTRGCRCRVFRSVLTPPRELLRAGWRAYWTEVGARGGTWRWAGWFAGSVVGTFLYELAKACAQAAWAYIP